MASVRSLSQFQICQKAAIARTFFSALIWVHFEHKLVRQKRMNSNIGNDDSMKRRKKHLIKERKHSPRKKIIVEVISRFAYQARSICTVPHVKCLSESIKRINPLKTRKYTFTTVQPISIDADRTSASPSQRIKQTNEDVVE